MTFAREKRVLLGLVALGVTLPLPLADAIDWASVGLFVVAVALFVRRAWAGSERWLSNRALNLLGLAYLPLLVLDVAAIGRIQPVRPVLHLTMFGVAAKLWSIQREKDKWQAWIGVFFLFLAAMATSTHPSVVAYLLAFVALSVAVLARFVHLHVLAAFAGLKTGAPRLGLGGVVATVVTATALVAIPLFALLPRVRSPFVIGPGAMGGDPAARQMGFSDEINLDLIGRLRENPEVALRLELEGRHPNPGAMRFKAGVYEEWEGRTWRPAPGSRLIRSAGPEERFVIAPGAPVGRARIALEPLRSASLVVPVETVAIESAAFRLVVSDGGAISLPGLAGRTYEYSALLGPAPVSAAVPPGEGLTDGSLAPDGITPELARLAEAWTGEGTAAARATRIERRLLADYRYTTEFIGRGGASPIEDFLLRSRAGHCEYFASAMVLLLRAQGIPARLVTGFYGAEWSSWERVWLVRQSNAHAWVEAWLPETGWTVFDPTPPDGRPRPLPAGFLTSLRQAWEAVERRWDRWVISYDFDDQVGVLGAMRGWWRELVRRLTSPSAPDPPAPPPGAVTQPVADTPAAGPPERPPVWPWVAAALAVSALGSWLLLRRRGAWTATRAYSVLRATLSEAGLPIADSLAPLALARLVEHRLPTAAPHAGRLVESYVAESFAGRAPGAGELARLRDDLVGVERAVRRTRRGRRADRNR